MPHPVSFANWDLEFSVPSDGRGLVIHRAKFGGRMVLYHGSAPFVLVPYHGGTPRYKDGLSADCGGVPLTALTPDAPNKGWASNAPTGDGEFDPASGKRGPVLVERRPRTIVDPRTLVLTAKFGVGNYQYVHRWTFREDGSMRPEVGLAGTLYRGEPARGHVHSFYFRLDFDIDERPNVFERFDADDISKTIDNNAATGLWKGRPKEVGETIAKAPAGTTARYTRFRVRSKSKKNSAGRFASYEIIPSSEAPDGTFSTGDVWAVRYASGGAGLPVEIGAEVKCDDGPLGSVYANGESIDGTDLVVWYVLRVHHLPRQQGEETIVVPYRFLGFEIQPRDFLDGTPTNLYDTASPSP